jgi:hypothetical protein
MNELTQSEDGVLIYDGDFASTVEILAQIALQS